MTVFLFVVNLAWILLLSLWHRRRFTTSSEYSLRWAAWCVRILGGVAVVLYYDLQRQGGDIFVFFNDASALAEFCYKDPIGYLEGLFTNHWPVYIQTTEPRSIFFVELVSIVNVITGNNVYVTSLWFSIFSFWCSYRLVLKLDQVFPTAQKASRIALLFLPSLIFWSSSLIKETAAFGAIAILAVHFLSLVRSEKLKWTAYIEIVLSVYFLLSLKYYWGAVLIPCMVSSLILHWIERKKKLSLLVVVSVWIVVFVTVCVVASFTHPNFYLERFLYVIVENHDAFVTLSRPENLIGYYNLSADWLSILANSPWALASGLFRPMIFETSSITGTIAAVENLFLLVLVVWKLGSIRIPSEQNRLIVIAAIAYIAVLCIFLALSTPNFGTLSRYRVGFLPFFVLLILVDHPVFKLKVFRSFKS